MICRKATFTIPDLPFPSSRAQNQGFCSFLAFRTIIFRPLEHKIEVFVRFLPSGPPFSGFSSTKSAFLCAIRLRNPYFQAFRARKWGFCALLDFGIGLQQQHSLFMVPSMGGSLLPWMLMKPIRHYRIMLLSRKPEFDGRW